MTGYIAHFGCGLTVIVGLSICNAIALSEAPSVPLFFATALSMLAIASGFILLGWFGARRARGR